MASKYKPQKIYLKMEVILLSLLLIPVIIITWSIAYILGKDIIEEIRKINK